jgi:hypothetical protein
MSVTFSAQGAETHFEDLPCDFPGCNPGNRCGYCDDGIYRIRVGEAPEVNFANANARAILDLLGLPTDDCGTVEADVVPMVRATILGVMNVRRLRAPLDVEASHSGGPGTGTCHVINCGNTDDHTMRRLADLDAVFGWAEEHKAAVNWG